MYEQFYGLNARPFKILPDPRYLYWSEAHSLAYTMLDFGIMSHAPVCIITGEIGSGKTTLVRHLINQLDEDVAVGLISNLQPGRGELLQWVLMALDQPFGDEPYVRLFQKFQDFVIKQYALGKRTVLIFDEAQNLSVDLLEELRMLSNINADSDELLQLILVGQPQLRDLLARPELVQFRQRISSEFHLNPMDKDGVVAYITHRLKVAGAEREIFTPGAAKLIYQTTGGVPRMVNILCDLCMMCAFSEEREKIDHKVVTEVLDGARRHGILTQFTTNKPHPHLVRSDG